MFQKSRTFVSLIGEMEVLLKPDKFLIYIGDARLAVDTLEYEVIGGSRINLADSDTHEVLAEELKYSDFRDANGVPYFSFDALLNDLGDMLDEVGAPPAPTDEPQFKEITVTNIAARNALNITHLPTDVFVQDDGDGRWALYKAINLGTNATYVKLSDPDLLNAAMTASQIKASYESNANTNAYTDAEKTKLGTVASGATANQTDSYLLDRANHTGSQLATTITADSTHRFVTDTQISTWDAAYGWGNHASAGYLTSASSLAWNKLTGVPTTISGYGITDAYTKTNLQTSGQASVHWDNITNVPSPTIPAFSTLTDVSFTSLANLQLVKYNSTSGKWENFTPTYISANQSITLSGDISGTGTTAITTTIGNNKVTLAMMATMATASILGRNTAGTGNVEVLSTSTTKTLLSLNNVENTAISTWSGSANITTLGTVTTGTLSTGVILGGVTITLGSDGTGDLHYRNSSGVFTRLGIGTGGQFLWVSGGLPVWHTLVAGDIPTLNQNTTGSAASFTGSLSGDVTGTQSATVVGKINGVALSGLATGILKNTTTTGVPSIAVAADFPTLNQSTTGSAATLTTARAIYGNNFDGSAALAQIIASTYGGTGNGFTKFSGAATSEKTYTLPNASAIILTDNAVVTVAQGGIGVGTLASNGVLYGNGTGAVLALAVNSTGTNKFLTQSSSGAPAWATILAGDIPTLNQSTTGSAGSVANALSIAAELISGGASSYNGSAAKSIAIQVGSVTNAMLAGSIDVTAKLTGTLLAAQFPAFTGEVTTSAGAIATTIDKTISPTWTGVHIHTVTRTVASGASAVLDDWKVSAATTTISGTTNITTASGFNKISLMRPTYSNATITITNAATLYVDNAPTITGGGVITNTWAIWVGAGNVNFAGTGNSVGTITSGTWNGTAITDTYISSAATWNAKQAALVSGTNIKTVNGSSLLGAGDLTVSGGGGSFNYGLDYAMKFLKPIF